MDEENKRKYGVIEKDTHTDKQGWWKEERRYVVILAYSATLAASLESPSFGLNRCLGQRETPLVWLKVSNPAYVGSRWMRCVLGRLSGDGW
ncbi:hypothetical protein E2C01_025585 [Portunus trituberculatus]|uniref:Uncharacterized protein n=1 Tax=Portunus trituberculatus TaxID=210409 RepID=A0A5B7EGB3_PORTR|nr:hypothetical protein [Portunus trituberculatus]